MVLLNHCRNVSMSGSPYTCAGGTGFKLFNISHYRIMVNGMPKSWFQPDSREVTLSPAF